LTTSASPGSARRRHQRRARNDSGLSDREWKIVEAMYRLMPDGPRMVSYEDIVVRAWELHPRDFGLRGYSDRHPDASDIHKRLYDTLKARGWVHCGPTGQKKFALTQPAWERAHARFGTGPGLRGGGERVSRATEEEMNHLERTQAADLYRSGRADDILDTDFFAFYRTSVRATPQEFEGRLSQVRQALDEAIEKGFPTARELREVDERLRKRFADLIAVKTERKKRRTGA
jgi:hypothetical protein